MISLFVPGSLGARTEPMNLTVKTPATISSSAMPATIQCDGSAKKPLICSHASLLF